MKIQSFRGADLRLSPAQPSPHRGWLMCPCTWTVESLTWVLLLGHRLFLLAGTMIICVSAVQVRKLVGVLLGFPGKEIVFDSQQLPRACG